MYPDFQGHPPSRKDGGALGARAETPGVPASRGPQSDIRVDTVCLQCFGRLFHNSICMGVHALVHKLA